ncbi:ribonuclease Y [Sphaerobacter thermophilus]|jgi:ribonuclease Y|uniref:Ribonuclease Y n=1 Tax=Sphaerobacter thermophilus (strain ATCC 49802 / DSM 20745 / KCCM 41009 / NCIMB 13125 / S 6022) TaxID=479434 RepID=D1C1M3_SPHTD|nr:ribonuclease Y [Sphaerobacter thermophilus]ACZ38140.1 RNA binding metal dependent phosphohydrolase [Sphaerobacter thermophilus DSM 20745]
MLTEILVLLAALVVGILAAVATHLYLRSTAMSKVHQAEAEVQRRLDEAEARRREMILEAKDEAIRLRDELEREYNQRRKELERIERRLQQKEEQLDRRLEGLERRERRAQARERELEEAREKLQDIEAERRAELERVAQLTTDEARSLILEQTEREMREQMNRMVREMEAEARAEAQRRAQNILATAIQRIASDYVAETTVSVVSLPSDDMKGRIIGREGRNIRALEQATGVDLIVDDTPEAVTLSSFDPVRREIARRALTKLIQDGRIHPARIEEVVNKTRQEVEQIIREEGERVALEANVQGLHPDLIKLLGRLKYRTSYGQNVLQHSLEVSLIAGALAAELGADVNVCKTAALLHDIGKAVDHEVDGPHALIGADIARRLGRSAKIVHAIAAHHGEEEPQTVEAFIVATADAISGARPGARREMVEAYIKRLEALEGVANSFQGVEKAYAIQAGREVRILVQPDKVDDLGAMRLARDIVKKIQESLEYPGQIKVTVIRETRAVEYAR